MEILLFAFWAWPASYLGGILSKTLVLDIYDLSNVRNLIPAMYLKTET